jgi:hypothetical protein
VIPRLRGGPRAQADEMDEDVEEVQSAAADADKVRRHL